MNSHDDECIGFDFLALAERLDKPERSDKSGKHANLENNCRVLLATSNASGTI